MTISRIRSGTRPSATAWWVTFKFSMMLNKKSTIEVDFLFLLGSSPPVDSPLGWGSNLLRRLHKFAIVATLVCLLINFVNNTVHFGFFGVHEEVAVDVLLYLTELLASSLGEHFVETVAGLEDVLGGDVNV